MNDFPRFHEMDLQQTNKSMRTEGWSFLFQFLNRIKDFLHEFIEITKRFNRDIKEFFVSTIYDRKLQGIKPLINILWHLNHPVLGKKSIDFAFHAVAMKK